MPRGELATLVFLVAFSAFAFIPGWRTLEVGGMAVFGWLIAALMLISPAIALVTFWRSGRRGPSGGARAGDVGGGGPAGAVVSDGGDHTPSTPNATHGGEVG